MRKVLIFLLILLAATLLASACGGGKGTNITPKPNPPINNPPDTTSQDITLSGLLTYTGLLQSDEGIERTSSATPIANVGVAILNGELTLGASVSSQTGWFEVTAEDVASDADLRLRVELKTSDSTQSPLYAELPFVLDGSELASVTLSLSGYDDTADGIPDGFRLHGGLTGGHFRDGVFDPNGLNMPFGGSGKHFKWLNEGDDFFEGTGGFGDGWSDNLDLGSESGSALPPDSQRPPGGEDLKNRIEVNGKVVEVDKENLVYKAEGVRMIFISGLVFEEHGTFAVHADADTQYLGLNSFDDIELGLNLRAVGVRLVDNVLQAKGIKLVSDSPGGEGFFAADGRIIEVRLDPREIFPPLGADVKIDGVLITMQPDGGMPNFEFGEFVIGATNKTVLIGVEHLGELQRGMRAMFFGPFSAEKLMAKLLITSPAGPPPPPPPPPPFGYTFVGSVVDLKPQQQLVGCVGYWDDIIDGGGFGDRPPWNGPNDPAGGSGGKEPMQAEPGWGRPEGFNDGGEGGVPPTDPNDPERPDQRIVWIKIVRETKLVGIEKFDDILIGDPVWSEMLIGPDGRVQQDENGNPIAAVFQVSRPVPPPPGVYGFITDVQVFDNAGRDGVVVIAPYRLIDQGGLNYPGNPDDPTLPPDYLPEEVAVRVVVDTKLEGVESLFDIVIGADAQALFRVNPETGTVVLDDEGRPIAEYLGVYVPPPPPPPPGSVYGYVMEVKVFNDRPQNNGTVTIDAYCYGQGGSGGGWIEPDDPSDPNGGGRDTAQNDPGDPTNPPDGTVPPYRENIVTVRVVPETALEGVGSLIEMAEITDPMEAEAIFKIGEDGLPVLDEAGNPIAEVLYVYPVTPPPPPDEFITMEGKVMEYVEYDYIVLAPIYYDGQMGIPEFRFEVDQDTKIQSESGIQVGDSVMIEGKGVPNSNGTITYFAKFIFEYEYDPTRP